MCLLKKSCFYLLFFSAIYSNAQNSTAVIDSLKIVVKTTDSLLQKAYAYSKLSWLHINMDSHMAISYNDTAYVLFEKMNNQKGIAISNYKYGVISRKLGNYEKALSHLELYTQYFTSKKDTFQIANGAFQIGVLYVLKGEYEKGLKEYYKAYNIYESSNREYSLGFTSNSIGVVYKKLKNYNKAIKFYNKAVVIHEKLGNEADLANVYNNLGNIYNEQNDYDSALKYYNKTLDINIKSKDNWGIGMVTKNIGIIHKQKKNYQMAINYFKKAYAKQKENNYNANMAETLSAMGATYVEMGEYNKAEKFLLMALNNSTESKEIKREVHLHLSELYEKKYNNKLALFHQKKYVVFNDSIINEKSIENINDLQVRYETEKKDKEIAEQQLQLVDNENEIQKRKTLYNYMTGVAVFSLLISILLWYLYQQRQKRKDQEILTLKRDQQVKTLESLMEGEEKERFRIAKELHDGVNGDLSAIKYKLTSLIEKNNEVINEAVTMIDKSCEHVRAISHNLIPPALEKFSLIEAVEGYCTTVNDIHQPEITFQHIGEKVQLSKKDEINIFRIIQELVANSIKHANATEINVQISNRAHNLQITVEDNGKGFDKSKVKGDGIGLKNIESRVDYLNANLDFVSNEKGTSYTIEIDVK